MTKHEIQSEINARHVLLNQTMPAAIAHMENVIGALLASQPKAKRAEINEALSRMEVFTPAEKDIVMLFGETTGGGQQICGQPDKDTGEVIKSDRQRWREELAAFEAQLATMPEDIIEEPGVRNAEK